MDKLTEQHLKKKIRNFITLNSVTKDEIRKEYNEIFDKLKEYEDKQEVAREIFEEIDTTIRTDIKANNRYYGDYQEGRNNAFYTVIRQLAELKKKYIGE